MAARRRHRCEAHHEGQGVLGMSQRRLACARVACVFPCMNECACASMHMCVHKRVPMRVSVLVQVYLYVIVIISVPKN